MWQTQLLAPLLVKASRISNRLHELRFETCRFWLPSAEIALLRYPPKKIVATRVSRSMIKCTENWSTRKEQFLRDEFRFAKFRGRFFPFKPFPGVKCKRSRGSELFYFWFSKVPFAPLYSLFSYAARFSGVFRCSYLLLGRNSPKPIFDRKNKISCSCRRILLDRKLPLRWQGQIRLSVNRACFLASVL